MSKVCFTMRSGMRSPNSSCAVITRLNRCTAAPQERRRQAADGRHQSFVLFTCRATYRKLYPHRRRRRHLIGRMSEEAASTSKVGDSSLPTYMAWDTNQCALLNLMVMWMGPFGSSRSGYGDLSQNGYGLSLSLSLSLSLLLFLSLVLSLSFGRGMTGPARGHVRTPQRSHVKKLS